MLGVEEVVGVGTGAHGLGGVSSPTSVCVGMWIHIGAEILPACQAPRWCWCCWLLNHTFRSGPVNCQNEIWGYRMGHGDQPLITFLDDETDPLLLRMPWASADFSTGYCWWVLIEWFFPWSPHAGLLVTEYLCSYIMHSTNWFLKHIILTKCEHSWAYGLHFAGLNITELSVLSFALVSDLWDGIYNSKRKTSGSVQRCNYI